jgi:cob(I)alamin adenosyltransferase
VVDVKDVMALIKSKKKEVELVLTGRGAPKEVIEAADLVTEMKEIKHPFRKGIEARVGIDF